MKVKGIMFSGFAAAILMGTVDASAYTIASKAYVDQQITSVSNGSSEAVEEVAGNLETLSGTVDTLSDTVGGINTALEGVEDTIYGDGETADALSNRFEAGSSVIDAINTLASEKQDALTGAAADAVASGVTSAKVSSYDTHIANNDIHVTTADKTKWNGYEATIATKAAASDLNTLGTKVGSGNLPATINNQAVSDIVGAITQLDAKLTSVATTTASSEGMTAANQKITALEGLVGNTAVATQISTAVEAEAAIARAAEEANAAAITTINEGTVMNSGITSAKVTQIDTNTGDIATNAASIGTLNTRTALLADKTTCTGPSDKCVLTIDKNTGSLAWVNIVGAGNNLSDLTDDVTTE